MFATQDHVTAIAAPDFTRDLDISVSELLALLDLASDLKRGPKAYRRALQDKSAALLFEKPSLRTRLTFELAMQQLGGNVVTVDGPVGGREPLEDVARNLERWVDVIVARTFEQSTIEGLAHWAHIPVVNALSDLYHPCQVLADLLTIREHAGPFRGKKLAFVGDGNNVAHSLMLNAARLGMDIAVATPAGYEPRACILQQAIGLASLAGSHVWVLNDPAAAVHGAHFVYTDVWASMGQEDQAAERQRIFQSYQVNDQLLDNASEGALFMHCLPAKRGQEVTESVMESRRNLAFDQAENRLHVQKALLLMLVQ